MLGNSRGCLLLEWGSGDAEQLANLELIRQRLGNVGLTIVLHVNYD